MNKIYKLNIITSDIFVIKHKDKLSSEEISSLILIDILVELNEETKEIVYVDLIKPEFINETNSSKSINQLIGYDDKYYIFESKVKPSITFDIIKYVFENTDGFHVFNENSMAKFVILSCTECSNEDSEIDVKEYLINLTKTKEQ